MDYFFHAKNSVWYAGSIVFASLWILRCILPWLLEDRLERLQVIGGALTTSATYIFLVWPIAYFLFFMITYYLWGLVTLLLMTMIFLGLFLRPDRPAAWLILISFFWIPMIGMFCGLWNLNMLFGGSAGKLPLQSNIRKILTVQDLKTKTGDVGECHPYDLAYDHESDTLIASFQDDWGGVFPRSKHKKHNLLAAFSTKEATGLHLRTLTFSQSQLPQNISLRPSEHRGWVKVFDAERKSFHIGAFRYDGNQIEMTALKEIPFEPVGIFDDPARDRLIVLARNVDLFELYPDTLTLKQKPNLVDLITPKEVGFEPWEQLLFGELAVTTAIFNPADETAYIGVLGHYVHALKLSDKSDRRVGAFPLSMGLSLDPKRSELVASQPMQRKILIIDASKMEFKDSYPIKISVQPVAWIPGTDMIVACSYSQNRTMIVDAKTGEIVQQLKLGRLQRAALADQKGKRVFLATGLGIFQISGAAFQQPEQPQPTPAPIEKPKDAKQKNKSKSKSDGKTKKSSGKKG